MKFSIIKEKETNRYFAYIRENGYEHGSYGETDEEALVKLIEKLKYSLADAEKQLQYFKEQVGGYDVEEDNMYVYSHLNGIKKALVFAEKKLTRSL